MEYSRRNSSGSGPNDDMSKPFAAGRLLVTGATGFVGGFVRQAVAAGVFGDAEFIAMPESCDIRDPAAVETFVTEQEPDLVLHLAAQSFVPLSFQDPRETFEINLLGTLNLLLALRRTSFEGRLIYVSSGDVYGRVPESELPVNEDRAPAPLNPYAVSKVAAEQLCLQWYRSFGLDVVIARPFNHIGPGQDPRFVVPALATQVVAVARGNQRAVIEAGDLDVTRDFTDVRDVVAAYAALFRSGVRGRTYVVASGKERRIRDLLISMCAKMGIEPEIRSDPHRIRHVEQRRMVADHARLSADTGWQPQLTLEQTIGEVLDKLDRVASQV